MADDQKNQRHQAHVSKRDEDEDVVPIFSPKQSLPRRRRIKYCGLAIAVVLLQVVIVGVLCLTVFRFKDPNIKLSAISMENLSTEIASQTTVNLTLREEIKVKNQNWGKLKYDEIILVLSHEGVTVGQGTISGGSIGMRHSKEVSVLVEAKVVDGVSGSSDVMRSGVLNLKSYAKLSGKVNMVGVVSKRRSGEMNCSLTISLSKQEIQDFQCQ